MTQADAGALNPGSEQYTRWFSLLQQTFGREPGQTHSLTQVAMRALADGAGPDQALEAARTAATTSMGMAVLPVAPVLVPAPPSPPAAPLEAAAWASAPPADAAEATAAAAVTLAPVEDLAAASATTAAPPAPAAVGPWWTHPLLVGLLLLVLPPVGLYLLWTSPRFPEASRKRVTVIVVGCWAVVIALIVIAVLNTTTTTKV
jgi:hypothetical protein